MATYWLMDEYFKSSKEKSIETFARRHSAEYLEAAKAEGKATGFLPHGTDLTAVAKAAATESVRVKAAAESSKPTAAAALAPPSEPAAGTAV